MSEGRASLSPEKLLAHADFLRALARSILDDEHYAEDVVQEAWLAVLRRDPRPLRAPRAWLKTVVRNLSLKVRRGEGRRMIPGLSPGLYRVQARALVSGWHTEARVIEVPPGGSRGTACPLRS